MKYVPLPTICRLRQWPTIPQKEMSGHGYPVYGANGIIGYHSEYNHERSTLFIGCRGTCGSVHLSAPKSYINGNAMCLDDLNPSYSLKFVFYFLKGYDWKKVITGTGISQITQQGLQKVLIPEMPLEKQSDIVETFEFIDRQSNFCMKQIHLLEEQIKSLFNEMFLEESYRLEPLKKHIDLLAGYPFDGSGFTDEGTKICGGLIIMPDQIKWDECKHWPTKNGLDKYLLQEGDIVMAMDRPWINGGFKIGQIKSEDLPCLLIQRTARIRATDIDQTYLLACYKYGGFERHTNVTGSTVPHISGKDIESFCVPLAPITKQKRFAETANQIDKLRFI